MKIFILEAKKQVLNYLKILIQNERGDHRRHLHYQRGGGGGPQEIFKKIKKCLKPFQTLKKSSQTIFFMKNIYFRGKKTGFELFRNFDLKPKGGGPQASLAVPRGDHKNI